MDAKRRKPVQFFVGAVLANHLRVGGAGGTGHRLAGQVGVVLDARVFLRQQAGAGVEDIGRKRHVFGAHGVVGGRATFQVNGAVDHQRNPVLRCDGHVVHFKIRLFDFLAHVIDDGFCQLDRKTDGRFRADQVAERHRRFTVGHADLVGVSDFLQRLRAGVANQTGSKQRNRHEEGDFHGIPFGRGK